MGQYFHWCAMTAHAARALVLRSKASNTALCRGLGVNEEEDALGGKWWLKLNQNRSNSRFG